MRLYPRAFIPESMQQDCLPGMSLSKRSSKPQAKPTGVVLEFVTISGVGLVLDIQTGKENKKKEKRIVSNDISPVTTLNPSTLPITKISIIYL